MKKIIVPVSTLVVGFLIGFFVTPNKVAETQEEVVKDTVSVIENQVEKINLALVDSASIDTNIVTQ